MENPQQRSSKKRVYFILMHDRTASKKLKKFSRPQSDKTVLAGSLWFMYDADFKKIDRSRSGGANGRVTFRSAEEDDLSLNCGLQDVTKLTEVEFQLLLALTTCKQRLTIYAESEKVLREGCRLFMEWESNPSAVHLVEVIDEKSLKDKIAGTIKYVGPIPGRNGYWFGVELDEVSSFEHVEEQRTHFHSKQLK